MTKVHMQLHAMTAEALMIMCSLQLRAIHAILFKVGFRIRAAMCR